MREDGDRIAIGALSRHADLALDPVLAQGCGPLVAARAGEVGDPQVRHRGTIGGSVSHGDPASDLGTILLTLDADFVAQGPDGERTIPGDGVLHRPVRDRARAAGAPDGDARPEGRRRRLPQARAPRAGLGDGRGRRCARERRRARRRSPAMGPTPLRARAVEQALAGGASPADAAAHAAEGTEPPSDVSGSAEYRAHLAQVLTRQALEQL